MFSFLDLSGGMYVLPHTLQIRAIICINIDRSNVQAVFNYIITADKDMVCLSFLFLPGGTIALNGQMLKKKYKIMDIKCSGLRTFNVMNSCTFFFSFFFQ